MALSRRRFVASASAVPASGVFAPAIAQNSPLRIGGHKQTLSEVRGMPAGAYDRANYHAERKIALINRRGR
jgi:hypothetical protein